MDAIHRMIPSIQDISEGLRMVVAAEGPGPIILIALIILMGISAALILLAG